jgi:TPR repeat protein
MYEYGKGVTKDEKQAVEWFRKSAEPNAQYILGRMYEYGRDVTKDEKQAVEWYRKYVKQNHDRAIQALKRLGVEL